MSTPPVLLGIDFGGTKIAVALADPSGRRLASATVDSAGEFGARAAFDRGVRAARELLDGVDGRPLAAVGVSTFGIPFDDRVELAPAIPGWDDLAIGRELRAAFPGAIVRMATDAKAAASAEATWGALAGCDPAIYLNLGTGLSAAIVTGGNVLLGRHGASGEIGYNLRAVDDTGLALDHRVPLEWMVSARALAKRGTSAAGSTRDLTAAEVFKASTENEALGDVIDEFVAELSFHLVNLAISIDPVRIAVGGGMTGSWDRLRPGLERALSAGVPFPPELVLAAFPFDAPLIGAVALAVEAAQDRLGTVTARIAQHGDGKPGPEPALNNAHTTKD
ncbi:MAG TPA: ROK family protein [Streptosporangiaceae bacterium]|jgi:glucokinase